MGRRHGLGEAEIEHLDHAVGTNLDVGGLQIAMDDALVVGGFDGIGNPPRDRQRIAERQASSNGSAAVESVSLDDFKHQRVDPVHALDAVNRGDVRMVQRRQ